MKNALRNPIDIMDSPFLQQPGSMIKHGYGRHDSNPQALKNLLYIDNQRAARTMVRRNQTNEHYRHDSA